MKVLIRSARDSFWRGGLKFTRQGVVVDTDELTEAQQEAITAEPQLSVGPAPDAEDEAEDAAKKAAAEAKKAAAADKAKAALKSSKKAK
jgi:hypothetical protein